MSSSVNALRPMNLGELLDRTFYFFRTHFLLFVGITALPHLFLLAIQMFEVVSHPPRPTTTFGMPNFNIPLLILQIVLGIVIYAATQAATITAVSRIYLGEPVSVKEAYAPIMRRIVAITLMTIALSIAAGVGIVFCVVPGIVVLVMCFLTIPVAILERKGFLDSAQRSVELTRGWRFHILLIGVLYLVLLYVFTLLFQVPVIIFGVMSAGADVTALPTWVLVASAVGSFLSSCLATPLVSIATSLVYYNQRVRNEAFDLEHMMTMLDDSAPASTS